MKNIKKLTALVLGGIGAIFGLQSLSGCSEDVNSKPVVKLTQEQIKDCCGDDDGTNAYAKCIQNYQKNGVCSKEKEPEPIAYYGPAPTPVPEKDIADCCSDKADTDYLDCANKFNNYCDDKQFSESMSLEACVAEFKKANKCDVMEPVYGMQPLPVPDEDIADCCGFKSDPGYQECADKFKNYCNDKQFSESMSLEACVEEYKQTNNCDVPVPEYGMIPVEECCGSKTDSDEYKACVDFYNKTGECDNNSTVYGPAPVPVPDTDIADCCGFKSEPGYQECADKFNNYCDGKQFYESMSLEDCVEEYKQVNHCEVPVPEYGMPSISDEDIQNCCGEDSQSSDYKECVEKYLATEVCPNMNSTVYGMPPLPDA